MGVLPDDPDDDVPLLRDLSRRGVPGLVPHRPEEEPVLAGGVRRALEEDRLPGVGAPVLLDLGKAVVVVVGQVAPGGRRVQHHPEDPGERQSVQFRLCLKHAAHTYKIRFVPTLPTVSKQIRCVGNEQYAQAWIHPGPGLRRSPARASLWAVLGAGPAARRPISFYEPYS